MAKPLCKMTLKDLLDYLAAQMESQVEMVPPKQVDIARIKIVPLSRLQTKIDKETLTGVWATERGRSVSLN